MQQTQTIPASTARYTRTKGKIKKLKSTFRNIVGYIVHRVARRGG